MNIGIITQPLLDNYGGLLQNYALQFVLKRMGHVPITLDQTKRSESWIRNTARNTAIGLLSFLGKNNGLKKLPYLNKSQKREISKHTRRFIDTYINHTKAFRNSKQISFYLKKHTLDAFIVGSDQVWRPKYCVNIYTQFLDFANAPDVKRLAYAASFGTDEWTFSNRQTMRCGALANRFDAISVREKSGITLCKNNLGIDAQQVLDPTMLLAKEDYIYLVEKENEPVCDGDLFCYVLDMNPEKQSFIEECASLLDLTPFYSMPKPLRKENFNGACLKEYTFPTVTHWLRGFLDAKMVIVDSFHGCAFSIIFNKPFWVIGNKSRGNTRFDSLLGLFGLENRMIEASQVVDLTAPINWEDVNTKLIKYKTHSCDWLKMQLK